MATDFLDLATTLENLGARWLLEKKVNFVPWNGFKFLTHLKSKTSPFKIVFKSHALIHNLKYKKCFKFLLAIKVKNSWR